MKSVEKSGRSVMKVSNSNTIRYRVLLAAAVIIILYLATTPLKISVIEDVNDKANHIVAFYVLAFLLDFSFPGSAFVTTKVISLLGFGLSIEIIQYFLPYRTFSLFDLAADALALVVYRLSLPWLRLLPLFRKRWE